MAKLIIILLYATGFFVLTGSILTWLMIPIVQYENRLLNVSKTEPRNCSFCNTTGDLYYNYNNAQIQLNIVLALNQNLCSTQNVSQAIVATLYWTRLEPYTLIKCWESDGIILSQQPTSYHINMAISLLGLGIACLCFFFICMILIIVLLSKKMQ